MDTFSDILCNRLATLCKENALQTTDDRHLHVVFLNYSVTTVGRPGCANGGIEKVFTAVLSFYMRCASVGLQLANCLRCFAFVKWCLVTFLEKVKTYLYRKSGTTVSLTSIQSGVMCLDFQNSHKLQTHSGCRQAYLQKSSYSRIADGYVSIKILKAFCSRTYILHEV